MRLLRKQAHLPGSTLLAETLAGPCTSMAFAQQSAKDDIYLVLGRSTGEALFYPVNPGRHQISTNFVCENKIPITAVAEGCLRDKTTKEVVIIQANGLVQALDFPTDVDGPTKTFSQQIYANINDCRIMDIDGDKNEELLVMLTDRVVRSYRYDEESDRLLPLNKWEMPAQISGWCIGFNGHYHYLILSQCDQKQYVTIDFGPTKEVKVQNSWGNEKNLTQLIIATRPQAADLAHCLAETILVVNLECKVEAELREIKMDVCCAGALTLDNGLSVVVTMDPKGQLLVFGWTKEMLQTTEPLARCMALAHPVFLCVFPHQRELAVCVSVIDVYNKVAVYLIDLSHVICM